MDLTQALSTKEWEEKEPKDELDHDFAFLSKARGIAVTAIGDPSIYTTTGKGTVRTETEKEYDLCEQQVEQQSGRTIFMAFIDFGPASLPVRFSERVETIATVAPQQSVDEARMCKGIQKGTILPTREEFKQALARFEGGSPTGKLMDYCYEHGLYEVLTQEYIDALAIYLAERIRLLQERSGKTVTILEVGAGDGRLTHFLREALMRCQVREWRIQATDGGQWRIPPLYPVTNDDVDTALWDYEPQIVLACWMPKHEDWTEQMRKAPSVEEYILIGPKDSNTCGDAKETWGQEIAVEKKASHERDGFQRCDLESLSELQLGQKDRDNFRYSSTVSFRRSPPQAENLREKTES